MLSPGQWHKQVPKDRDENLVFRQQVLRACREHAWARKAALEACRQDILFFVNVFVWQVNPRHKGQAVGPFITWDFQDEAALVILDHIERDRDLLIEKSREMGASWLCLIVMDWLAMFQPWQTFLCISHSEQAVDNGDPNYSLLPKVQFIHEHLPSWLLEEGSPVKQKLRIRYRTQHSSINGAATSVRSGVGARTTGQFLDEFSKQGDDYEILGQTADVGMRVFNGTHFGLEKAFYQLTQRPDLDKLVMHWSQHPEKRRGLYKATEGRLQVLDATHPFPPDYRFVLDGSPNGGPFPGLRSPWYDQECVRRASARDVAMHLDINPSGSQSQFFEPAIVRVLIEEFALGPFWRGELTGGKLTPGPGPLALWLHPKSEDRMPEARYGVGVDIAAGTGASPSCVSIANAQTGEKVAAYVNPNLSPEALAAVVAALGRLFCDGAGLPALVAWEASGGLGEAFAKKFLATGYRNVWYRETPMSYAGMRKSSDKPGWYSTPSSKRVLLEEYRSALALRLFVNRCELSLKETLAFRYAGDSVEHPGELSPNDPSGARVNHGDRVIADALAWMACQKLGADRTPEQVMSESPPFGSLAYRRQLRREEESWA